MTAFDLAIIGSGPGGYVAAIRGAQLGLHVAIIEEGPLGGICLNWGCIPTKAILNSASYYDALTRGEIPGIRIEGLSCDYPAVIAASRKAATRLNRGVASLMKKNKIEVIQGRGRLAGSGQLAVQQKDGERSVQARHILLATGSTELVLPGIEIDGQQLLTSREALDSRKLPSSMLIIGGGAVGLEFAFSYSAYGVQVTLIEMQDQLVPGLDREVADALASAFSRRGVKIRTDTAYQAVERNDNGVKVTVQGERGEEDLHAEQMLLAVGRRAQTEGIGLEEAGVALEGGFVKADPDHRTTADGIWAIGDLTGPPLLAHKASEQGKAAVEFMAGVRKKPLDPGLIPACIYSQPQVATVGLSEDQARAAGHEVSVGKFPFAANGKAVGTGHTEGFVKLVTDTRYGEILGGQAIGAGVTELIAEVALAMTLESTVREVGDTCHAHPTLSEAIMETALAAEGRAIHF